MTRLLFTTDGLMCEQAHQAQPRALSRIAEGPDGAVRLIAADAEHVLLPFARSGWAFELRDGAGLRSGGFEPFRLRRGGRLRVGEVGLSLSSRPWSHEGWTFTTPRGPSVEATVAVAERDAGANAGASDGRAPSGLLVALETSRPREQALALTPALALGCWLIVRWHSDPGDHVLASPHAAGALADGAAGALAAGIRRAAAN